MLLQNLHKELNIFFIMTKISDRLLRFWDRTGRYVANTRAPIPELEFLLDTLTPFSILKQSYLRISNFSRYFEYLIQDICRLVQLVLVLWRRYSKWCSDRYIRTYRLVFRIRTLGSTIWWKGIRSVLYFHHFRGLGFWDSDHSGTLIAV